MLSVVMLRVLMLSELMLSVAMLSVVILDDVAPLRMLTRTLLKENLELGNI